MFNLVQLLAKNNSDTIVLREETEWTIARASFSFESRIRCLEYRIKGIILKMNTGIRQNRLNFYF